MRPFYFLFFSVPLLLLGQQEKSVNSDIWIIENPSVLVIYNQYEQRMSEDEKSQLPSHSAWWVLNNDYLLSDQFTHTMKVALNRQIFYIQLSEDGEIVNGELAGNTEILKKVRTIRDTVQVKTDMQLLIRVGDEDHVVEEKSLVERIFFYRSQYFVKDLALNVSGWVNGNISTKWEPFIVDKSDTELEVQLFSKVDQIISSYNNRLDKLFQFLNTHYNASNPSPKWISEKSTSYVKYTLSPKTFQNRFTDSQKFLVQEINDLLYGSTYHLSTSDGQLIIFKSKK